MMSSNTHSRRRQAILEAQTAAAVKRAEAERAIRQETAKRDWDACVRFLSGGRA